MMDYGNEENYENQGAGMDSPRFQEYLRNKKIVSLGLNSYSPEHSPRSPRRDEEASERSERNDRIAKYQAQLQEDQNRSLESSRKPYVRNIEDDSSYTGLMIGNQMNENSVRQKKLEEQRAYREQLMQDRGNKPMNIGRKPVQRTIGNGASGEPEGYFAIGKNNYVDPEAKRSAVAQMQARKKADFQYQMEQEKAAFYAKQQQIGRRREERDDQIQQIENGHFHIGEDSEEIKRHRKELQAQHAAQLDRDYGRTAQDNYPQMRSSRVSEEMFVNRTGHTGLDIGGASSGNTRSKANLAVKQQQQDRYRQQLDAQMKIQEERKRQEKLDYRGL